MPLNGQQQLIPSRINYRGCQQGQRSGCRQISSYQLCTSERPHLNLLHIWGKRRVLLLWKTWKPHVN